MMPFRSFELSAFCQIDGIGAASGLVIIDNNIYLLADHASYLYCYEMITQQLSKISLTNTPQDILAKADKFDLEAIVHKDESLFLFGSGSTSKRHQAFQYNLATHVVTRQDLSDLHQTVQTLAKLQTDELNLEGAIYSSSQWLFFQRGNGLSAINGIFILDNDDFSPPYKLEFIPITLPQIQDTTASFTDAIQVGEFIYFLAAVESSASTYEDGEVLGSFIGRMCLKQKKIDYVQQISQQHKFEGLALYRQSADQVEFLLCEDNDTHELRSTIYQLSLSI